MGIKELIKAAKPVDMFSDIPSDEKKEINLKGKIAAAIINKRYKLNMSQTEFANKMNVSQTMVSKWESGDYNFSCDIIEKLLPKIGLNLSIEDKNFLISNFAYKTNTNSSMYGFSFGNNPIRDISVINMPNVETHIIYYSNSKKLIYSTI